MIATLYRNPKDQGRWTVTVKGEEACRTARVPLGPPVQEAAREWMRKRWPRRRFGRWYPIAPETFRATSKETS